MVRLVAGAHPSVGKNYQAWGRVRLEKALFPKVFRRGFGKPTIVIGAAKVIMALSLKSCRLGFDGSNMAGKRWQCSLRCQNHKYLPPTNTEGNQPCAGTKLSPLVA